MGKIRFKNCYTGYLKHNLVSDKTKKINIKILTKMEVYDYY